MKTEQKKKRKFETGSHFGIGGIGFFLGLLGQNGVAHGPMIQFT